MTEADEQLDKGIGTIAGEWIAVFLALSLVWVLAAVGVANGILSFKTLYADFGMRLPAVTQWLLVIAVHPARVAILAAIPAALLPAALGGFIWQIKRGDSYRGWFICFSLIGIGVMLALVVIVVALPMRGLLP